MIASGTLDDKRAVAYQSFLFIIVLVTRPGSSAGLSMANMSFLDIALHL